MLSKARILKAYDCQSSWNIFNHFGGDGAVTKSLLYKCTRTNAVYYVNISCNKFNSINKVIKRVLLLE